MPRLDIYRLAERLMAMDDNTWARHANPLSFWTRLAIVPLLSLAFFSRIWLGWGALVPVALVLAWVWINPRAFAAPGDFNAWASRAVLGERVWLNRSSVAIPAHHRPVAHGLSVVSGIGLIPWIYGMWALDVSLTLLGLVLSVGAKLWFCDRMAWLWQDMGHRREYQAWIARI